MYIFIGNVVGGAGMQHPFGVRGHWQFCMISVALSKSRIVNTLLVLQNFTIARKAGTFFRHTVYQEFYFPLWFDFRYRFVLDPHMGRVLFSVQFYTKCVEF